MLTQIVELTQNLFVPIQKMCLDTVNYCIQHNWDKYILFYTTSLI